MVSAASFSHRGFVFTVAALLLMMALAEIGSMTQESQTVDESYHLLAGYQFLKTGRLPAHSEQPPLAQAIAAVPLLPMALHIPDERQTSPQDDKRREREFFYENVRPMEEILMRARLARLITTLLLGVLIAWWMRRHFGVGPALASVTLFAFDPNFLAHGHYSTNDAPAALVFLWGCISWNWFLKTGTKRRAMLSGLVFGIALGTKVNTVVLIPVFVVLYVIDWWCQKGRTHRPFSHGVWHLSKTLGIMCLVSVVLLFASFRFQTGKILPPDPTTHRQVPLSELMREHPHSGGPLRGLILNHPGVARMADVIVDLIPFPAPDLFRLLYVFFMHATSGHHSYLLGKTSETGWWFYFPVVFAVKTPTGDLLLLLFAICASGTLLFSRSGRDVFGTVREARLEWFVLAVPPVIYFAICILSKIDLGVRHLLPIYPFLFMGIGAVLFSCKLPLCRAVRVAAVAGIAIVVGESAIAYPNYLAFFNAPSGGMRKGSNYVVDSNLDWGQDIKRLGLYLKDRGNPPVCLAALNEARLEYYGIVARPFPADLEQAHHSDCLVVISLTTLKESNTDGQLDWLVRETPADRIGGSLLVYNLAVPSSPPSR